MTDTLDMASLLEQRQRDAALACALGYEKPNSVMTCELCGEPIGAARKKAVPSARLCVNCQSKKEMQ